MVTKWMHVAMPRENTWVLPIWSVINNAIKNGICSEPNKKSRELGIHISTRLNLLPLITKRINSDWRLLYSETQKFGDEYVFEKNKDGYAVPVKPEVLNQLLVDIDSFLFETNSCCELMKKFLYEIHKHYGEEIPRNEIGSILQKILIDNGQNPNWFRLLASRRNFFIHEGAPYVSIDISNKHPDLLIMKENLKTFTNHKKFFRLSDFDSIIKGFSEAIVLLQEYIIKLYGKKMKKP